MAIVNSNTSRDVTSIINVIYRIYNLIRAVVFSKFERLFKRNMYSSIIQSIAHLKL